MIPFKKYISDTVINEAVQYQIQNNIPPTQCIFRYGSEKFFEYYLEIKNLYKNNLYENFFANLDELDIEILNSDIGEYDLYNNELVPLDFIYEEKIPELNKPKRGGPKKFFVHVRDPKTGNIKKIAFGDTTGLSVKYDNPERKRAFAARHNCSDKTDKTTPGYWACRVNRYMAKTAAGRSGYW